MLRRLAVCWSTEKLLVLLESLGNGEGDGDDDSEGERDKQNRRQEPKSTELPKHTEESKHMSHGAAQAHCQDSKIKGMSFSVSCLGARPLVHASAIQGQGMALIVLVHCANNFLSD